MNDAEKAAIEKYVGNGGVVIASGPCAIDGCESNWVLPTRPQINDPNEFFSTIANGVWHKNAEWITNTVLDESTEPNEWREVRQGIYYNPHRISDRKIKDSFLELVARFVKKLPVEILESNGYLTTMFENDDYYVMHFLA